jgi:D-amino-acid oxidase
MTAKRSIVVVGAGVCGLTTGIELLQAGLPVRIVAEEIPGRTSLAAGAMWGPYHAEPWDKVWAWGLVSLEVFRGLSDLSDSGVRMVSGIEASRQFMDPPPWGDLLPDCRPCGEDELPPGFVSGYRFTVPLIDMPIYLDHLQSRVMELGGRIETGTVGDWSEIKNATAIVNCTGLGASRLAGDTTMRAICGEHVVLKNPGIDEFFSEDTGMSPDLVCFYPHGDTIVLGGTAIDNNGSIVADHATAERIIERCSAIDSRLANAQLLDHRVGGRPTRPQVRVEQEDRQVGPPVVHNYGHGGAGVTLSWGCAMEVVRLVRAACLG